MRDREAVRQAINLDPMNAVDWFAWADIDEEEGEDQDAANKRLIGRSIGSILTEGQPVWVATLLKAQVIRGRNWFKDAAVFRVCLAEGEQTIGRSARRDGQTNSWWFYEMPDRGDRPSGWRIIPKPTSRRKRVGQPSSAKSACWWRFFMTIGRPVL